MAHFKFYHIYYIKSKEWEVIMGLFKKTIGVCMVGFGIGAILVLLLPAAGWVFAIGVILLILGLIWLCK